MKINFDQLLQLNTQQPKFPNHVFEHKQPQQPLNYHPNYPYFSQNFLMAGLNQQQQKRNKNHSKNINFYDFIQQKLNPIKLQKSRQYKTPKIAKRKINEQELIDRLYKSNNCLKKQCKQYKTERQILIIENKYEINMNQANKVKKIENKHTKNSDKNSKVEGKWPTYLRLYHHSKIQESVRRLNQQQQVAQNHPQILQTSSSKRYMQNYIPFYKRLSQQITKSNYKLQYYNKNPHLSSNTQKQFFELSLPPNKYRSRVQSRYKRESSRQTVQSSHQIYNSFNNSLLNSSFCNSQVSLELISQVQDHFFNKMKFIFVDSTSSTSSNIIITEQIIQLLTQVEFRLMQGFILQIQRKGLRGEDFQYKLRQYYYSLPIHDRIQLRNHERKRKNTKNSKKQKEKTTNLKQKGHPKPKKKTIAPTNAKYLKKIQYYV